jgi:hypothetical protein
MAAKKIVHGDDLLYRFFLQLSESDPTTFAAITPMFLECTAIWLPLEVYERSPVLLPWVVRDNSCRPNGRPVPDEWASPNKDGYLRDDNSLVKTLPRSLDVRGPKGSKLNGARMGTEFVAAHIWRKVNTDKLANQIPLLNTFVPNLVWLPSQIAKLSDREDGIVQRTLQALSRRIYSASPVESHLQSAVAEAWSLLPNPLVNVEVDLDRLNWFVSTDRFFKGRKSRLNTVVDALETIAAGQPLTRKVVASRYTEGLPRVDAERRQVLLQFLRKLTEPAA